MELKLEFSTKEYGDIIRNDYRIIEAYGKDITYLNVDFGDILHENFMKYYNYEKKRVKINDNISNADYIKVINSKNEICKINMDRIRQIIRDYIINIFKVNVFIKNIDYYLEIRDQYLIKMIEDGNLYPPFKINGYKMIEVNCCINNEKEMIDIMNIRKPIKKTIQEYINKMWISNNPITDFERKISCIIGMNKDYKNINDYIEFIENELKNIPDEYINIEMIHKVYDKYENLTTKQEDNNGI